jgi:cell division protein FtsB
MRATQWRQGLLVGGLLVVALGLISLIWGLADKMQIAVTEAHNAETQFKALEERKATLEANLTALNTERGKDAAIRTSFGVARPGEEVIVVVPPEVRAATTTPTWWESFWSWF